MQSNFDDAASRAAQRRGGIIVLVALLLIVLFAFTAYCVDIGWITLTKGELQNAADASAAAGARQLADNYAAYSTPTQANRAALIKSARDAANAYCTLYGKYNAAGGVKSLSIPAGDVQLGFTDAQGVFHPNHPGYPNTAQVTTRRDSTANGRLNLFFAPVLGIDDTPLSATASATIYTGVISSFNPKGGGEGPARDGAAGDDYGGDGSGFDCLLLPVAFDVNKWTAFTATGISPDGLVHKSLTESPQIKIYPCPHNAPGNFGLLCIGPYTNSNSTYKEWVLNGPSAADLQFLIDSQLLPLGPDSPRAWKASPGLRSALGGDFEAIIGQPRLLPLFQPVSVVPYQAAAGNGANATYNIVGFVGVTVSEVTGKGGHLSISVEPCSVIDPTAVFDPDTLYPIGAEPPTQLKTFTHTAAKFTR